MKNLLNDSFESFNYFEKTPDLVCIAGQDGFFKQVNQSVLNILGYTKQELLNAPIHSFIHEDDRERTRSNRQKLLNGEILQNFQNRYISKNGSVVWLEWTSIFFADKKIVLAIAKDITAKKEMEKAIHEQYKKFKNLTSYFKDSIEKDRKYFAYELHEDIAQLAAVVKMNIDVAAVSSPHIPAVTKMQLERAVETATLLIKTIQKMSFSVSPYMLEEFGMSVTMDWLCKEFTAMHGISCMFEADYDEACLSEEMQIDFFRICQEALKNVLEHANARKVTVRIWEEASTTICLSVQDNGKGFKKSAITEKSGLVGMRERAASLHGNLHIKSSPGKGTTITASFPKTV